MFVLRMLHLLSLLCSKSASRETNSPTRRRLSSTPTAWLLWERAEEPPSPSDFASMVLWDNLGSRLMSGEETEELLYNRTNSVYSHQTTHSVCVPHKQILAFVRLPHELGNADACRWAAVEHDGRRNHFGFLSPALRLWGNVHIQVSSWRKGKWFNTVTNTVTVLVLQRSLRLIDLAEFSWVTQPNNIVVVLRVCWVVKCLNHKSKPSLLSVQPTEMIPIF